MDDKILKDKYGNRGGWTVPEGYFDSVYKEIESKLPPYVEGPKRADMSRWQRLKPYVYLAAMFAGIWMMMQVFHRVSSSADMSLENPPEQIALAMAEAVPGDVYLVPKSMSDFELESEVSGNYSNMEDFERDFGYEFEPEYADIDFDKFEN